MDWTRAPSTPLQRLAVFWNAWTQFLVLFARRGLVMERGQVRDALRAAEDIEVFAAASAHILTRDIASMGEAASAADRHAAGHLLFIAQMLIVLAWLAREIKSRLLAGGAFEIFSGCKTLFMAALHTTPQTALPFQDSG